MGKNQLQNHKPGCKCPICLQPPKTKTQVCLCLPFKTLEALNELAEKNQLGRSEVVERILDGYLKSIEGG